MERSELLRPPPRSRCIRACPLGLLPVGPFTVAATAPPLACVVCLLGRFLVRERILFPIRLFFTCVPVLAVIDQLIAPYGYACLCLPPS
jgi:hypothetical protein